MKKFLSYLCALVLAFSSLALGVGFAARNNYSFAAELPTEQIMEGVVLTQDGHTITRADFEEQNNVLYLYTNATITINKITSSNDLSVVVAASPLVPKTDGRQWVLKYDEDELASNPSSAKKLVEMTLSTLPSAGAQSFTFYLIQTPNHFKVNPMFHFEDNLGTTLTAPTQTQTFSNFLTLKGVHGTADCPVFVDLYYNGEFYSIYSTVVGGNVKYFSTITGNEITVNATDGIKFNAAGQYEVYIYDKTAYSMMKTVSLSRDSFPTSLKPASDLKFECLDLNKISSSTFANIQSYAFTISDTAHNMYITAKDANGNDVLNSQTVNGSVSLSFHNLSYSQIGQIVLLTKYGSEKEIEEVLADNNESLDNLTQNGLEFNSDATYKIRFYDPDGNVILPAYRTIGEDYEEGHVYPTENLFAFSIVKDIHITYRELRATYINVIEEKSQEDIIVRFYTGIKENLSATSQKYLEGVNPYSFSVKLANPDTRISGVANGGSTDGTAAITVSGVGQIEVIVSTDTTTNTYSLTNGQKIPNTSAIGNYSIRITDQMGNTAAINFSVKQPLNVATIVLIVVGAVMLAVIILLIVRTRTKINVR